MCVMVAEYLLFKHLFAQYHNDSSRSVCSLYDAVCQELACRYWQIPVVQRHSINVDINGFTMMMLMMLDDEEKLSAVS